MRIAYLDCFSGISGDMFLGALVDAGMPPSLLEETVRALAIDVRVEVSRVMRAGIAATKVDVIVRGEKDMPREEWHQHNHSHSHDHLDAAHQQSHHDEHQHEHEFGHRHSGHEHGDVYHHGHDHEPAHEHAHEHPHAHSHADAQSLSAIRALIHGAPIATTAKATAVRMFENLGAAEAKIHNCALEDVHFHEVGAEDAIVDIVCAAVGSEALAVDEWVCSPLNVGGGTVVCAHGTLPVPAPATLELLKGAPIYSSAVQKELVTPTGAAIVKTLVSRFADMPQLRPEKTGYGAGFRDLHQQPNVVRLTVGESAATHTTKRDFASDTVTVLEANVDDMNPQIVGHVFDRLFEAGALDAFCAPVQMKKGRPGVVLTVLANEAEVDKLARILFRETTTIGLRMHETKRLVLPRRHVEVRTQWGTVRVKIANLNGTVANYAPEYDDCRRLAAEHGVPLKAVMQEAIRLYLHEADRIHHG